MQAASSLAFAGVFVWRVLFHQPAVATKKFFFEGWPPRKLKATTSATEFFLEKKVEKTCDANAALQSPARAGRRFKVRPATT